MVRSKHSGLLTRINPFIFSSLVILLCLYGKIIPAKAKYSHCRTVSLSAPYILKGRVISNPTKTKEEKYYSFDFLINYLENKSSGYTEYTSSKIAVLLSKDYVESYFPGRLYSAVKNNQGIICEQGAYLELNGQFLEKNLFCSKKAVQGKWNNSIKGKIARFRARNRLNFKRLMYAWGSAGGLLMALLTGMKEYTENSVSENFRMAGLSHILALSGMHLNLFSGIAKQVERVHLPKIISTLFQITAVFLFVWFAGISPSLLRALLCNVLGLGISFLNIRKVKKLDILFVAFLIHICIRPYDAFEISFILSYGAVGGILIFSEISNMFSAGKMPYKLSENLCSSFGAQGFTAPICLRLMGSFAPFGTISTLIVSPLITIFIYAGLVLIILCLIFPILVPVSAFIMKIIYTIIVKLVGYFSTLPSLIL